MTPSAGCPCCCRYWATRLAWALAGYLPFRISSVCIDAIIRSPGYCKEHRRRYWGNGNLQNCPGRVRVVDWPLYHCKTPKVCSRNVYRFIGTLWVDHHDIQPCPHKHRGPSGLSNHSSYTSEVETRQASHQSTGELSAPTVPGGSR